MPLHSFHPDAATSDAILQSIAAEYSLSLTDIADRHQTTIEALTAWLTREDIDERLTAIESACARRARLTAANHLPAVAHVAKQALEEASDVLRLPPDYRTQHSIALRIRATESARRAAALLLRIANFTPGPRRIRHHADSISPRITPPPALTSVPHAEIEPTTSPSAPPTETAPSAPTGHVATDRALAAPAAATPTDRVQSAPAAEYPINRVQPAPAAELPINRVQSATISGPHTEIESTTSPSAPPANRAQSAPTSLPPAESTPSEPISATPAARTTPAPHDAPPNPTSKSPAIPAWFTLVKPSAVPAPRHSPAPNAHPPPRKPTADTTRASFTPA